MKLLPLFFLLTSCTTTIYENGNFKRTSFLQKQTIQELEFPTTNGTVRLKGYDNDGGANALEKVAKGAAEGAVKGMKP